MRILRAFRQMLCRHIWGDWQYVDSHSCNQMRSCSKCNATEIRKDQHTWKTWEYMEPVSCDQRRQCQRCGSEEPRSGIHNWSDWVFDSSDPCIQHRACRHDGVTEHRHILEAIRAAKELKSQLSLIEEAGKSACPDALAALEYWYQPSRSDHEDSFYGINGTQEVGEEREWTVEEYPNAPDPLRTGLSWTVRDRCAGTANYEYVNEKPENRAHLAIAAAIKRLKDTLAA